MSEPVNNVGEVEARIFDSKYELGMYVASAMGMEVNRLLGDSG